jgi:hypothetical protein
MDLDALVCRRCQMAGTDEPLVGNADGAARRRDEPRQNRVDLAAS